jgi:DegV family protein with EDD domain
MIKVVTESTADIPADLVERLGIEVVPSYVVFGTKTYRDGVDLSRTQFYERLASTREIPKTATPPPAVYEEAYRRLAREGDGILSIHAAANLSSLYSVARVAAQDITSVKIAVVNSEQVSMGYGWMAVAAAEAAAQGATLPAILELVEDLKARSRVIAMLDTLDFVYRGGRVGWVEAMIGTLMRIKPLIGVQHGEIRLLERARTRARSLGRLIDRVEEFGPLDRAVVLHANDPEAAGQLADRLEQIQPAWDRLIAQAGATIASHTGPGAVGIACVPVI